MIIQLLVDNVNSWFVPYATALNSKLISMGFDSHLLHDHEAVRSGDILFILSCEKILKKHTLDKNKLNLVVHGSDLPKGRGWSPMTWEVLEGKNRFCLSLIEAAEKVDSGNVIEKTFFELKGYELNEEMKTIQGKEINKLIIGFLKKYPSFSSSPQVGEPSYYPRRTPRDSELDINKTLKDQFNLFRVVDNEKFPAFFHYMGHRYILKIERADKLEN
jgi:methionyl-tRNA formyltransferase